MTATGSIRRPALACAALAALSLIDTSMPTGFDPSAWLTWARSIARGQSIAFMVEPAWKPLPVLFMTPFSIISDPVAGASWMWLERSCALLTPVLAWRLVRPRFGAGAAVVSAVATAAIPMMWILALDGHSEPVAAAAALCAFDFARRGHRRITIACALAFCLCRPEAILILGGWMAWRAIQRREGALLELSVVIAIWLIAWFGLPGLFGGDPFQVQATANRAIPFRAASTVMQRLLMALSGDLWPWRLLMAILLPAGVVAVLKSSDRTLKLLAALAAGLSTVILLNLLAGASGASRYYLPATVALTCLAGPGAMLLFERVRSPGMRGAGLSAICALLAITSPLGKALYGHSSLPARNSELAELLDDGASTLRASGLLRDGADREAIGVGYNRWPQIAARSGIPMARLDYRVAPPVFALEQKRAPRVADNPLILGGSAARRVVRSGRGWSVVLLHPQR